MKNNQHRFKSVIVSRETIDLLKKSIKKCYKSLAEPKDNIKAQLDKQLAIKRLKVVAEILQGKQSAKVLDLGCGVGYLVAFLNKNNIDAYGIEPDKYSFAAAQSLLKTNKIKSSKIKQAMGESFNFKEKFDLIISFQVIEHTQNPQKVFKQCHQHLKKDGRIYFIIPNYHSFWEGHYGVLWTPWLNKTLAKIYIKLLGKDPSFINTIQFITPKMIKKILSQTDFKLISLGEEEFKQRMIKGSFMTFGYTYKLLPILSLIKFFKLNKLITQFCLKTNTFYPIIVYAKKST